MRGISRLSRLGWATLPAVLLIITGCDKGPQGPRRADHAAAHTSRYHPEVYRGDRDPDAPAITAPASTQPATINRGLVGCPVLFVNGETVTIQDILEPIVDELAVQARTLTPGDYQEYVIRRCQGQIRYYVSSLLIYVEAKKNLPEKGDEIFEKEADAMIRERINTQFGGVHARFEAHLKALELTMADIRERTKRQAMVSSYLRERFKPLMQEPTRRELLNYYQAHLEEFTTPGKGRLYMIEIPLEALLGKPVNQATEAELADARARARQQLTRAREELESGVEFGAVAKAYGKGVRDSLGGDWGEISEGSLARRWARPAEVLFTLKEGETSDIIETDEAFFLVRSGPQTPRTQQTFEQAQQQIIKRVLDEKFDTLRAEYIQSLLDKAVIRKQVEFLQAVVNAAPRPERSTASLHPAATPGS